VVDRAGEHPRELGVAHARLERGGVRGGLGDRPSVVLRRAELEQDSGVVQIARQLLDRIDVLLDAGPLARDGLRLLLIVPEARRERLLLELVELRPQPR
jgi:hypothetical protein